MTYLEHTGLEILEAADGEEGVRLALESAPDLILMDLSMPVKDGWEAIRELKADPRTRHIPVIALSAHVLIGDLHEQATEAGFEDYIMKPIEPRELIPRIERFLA